MQVTLAKGSCHRSYSLWRKVLSDLSFDLQSSKSGSVKRERKCDLCMPLLLLLYFLYGGLFTIFVFSLLYSFLLLAFLPSPFYHSWLPHFIPSAIVRFTPFVPSTVSSFLWASLQDCPLTCLLSSHYLCPECVGCTILYF